MATPITTDRFLRKPKVISTTGLSESTIWRREADGRFPARIRLSPRLSVWRESEIQEWMRDPLNYLRVAR